MTDTKIKLSEIISKETHNFIKNHNRSIFALDHQVSRSYKALLAFGVLTLLVGTLGDFNHRSELKNSATSYAYVSSGVKLPLLISYLNSDYSVIGKYIDKKSYDIIQLHLKNKYNAHSEQYLSSGFFLQIIYIQTKTSILKVTCHFNKTKLLYISIN